MSGSDERHHMSKHDLREMHREIAAHETRDEYVTSLKMQCCVQARVYICVNRAGTVDLPVWTRSMRQT